MKFRVYYIDDEAGARNFEGKLTEAAAWRFVREVPREGDAQVTVESLRSDGSCGIAHYRSTALRDAPEPVPTPYPILSMHRYDEGPESVVEVRGTLESLRLFAAKLSKALESASKGCCFSLDIENADSDAPTDTFAFTIVEDFAASQGEGGSFLERFFALREEFDMRDSEFRDRLSLLRREFFERKAPPSWPGRVGRWLGSKVRVELGRMRKAVSKMFRRRTNPD